MSSQSATEGARHNQSHTEKVAFRLIDWLYALIIERFFIQMAEPDIRSTPSNLLEVGLQTRQA